MARTGRPRELGEAKCEGPGCEQMFRPRYKGQKYHSTQCFHAARVGVSITHSRKPTGRPRIHDERICALEGCEEKFYPQRPEQIYHSTECYHEARAGKERGPYNTLWITKQCEACGEEFSVPYHRRVQRFHNLECQRLGRYRRGRECLPLTVEQSAYWASMIDGEGSIILYRRRTAVAMMVVIANTHRPMLDQAAEETGVGAVMTKDRVSDRHKTIHWWRCNADAAYSFLKQIRPYMRIKGRQADLAISFQERLRDPSLKADRTWQEAAREEMRRLNRRGPSA